LVEGLTREAEQRRGFGFGKALDMHLAQHLEFHLHQVARVEESAGLKPGSVYPLRMRIQGPERFEVLALGVVIGQVGTPVHDYVMKNTPHNSKCQGRQSDAKQLIRLK
jgi:hypothetical protein